MGILAWLETHWFELLQTASIVAGFWTAVHSIREETKERRIENLFSLTEGHREIWSKLYEHPELSRVLALHANLKRDPFTHEEELFVHTVVLHLRAAFKARDLGMYFNDDAVAADVRQFFSRPIPFAVWQRSKVFQDADFVAFVDANLKEQEDLERAA